MELEIASDPDQQTVQVAVEFVIKGYGEVFKYEASIKGE
jgi:hypothetical protein